MPVGATVHMQKGLFIVLLYAAFEYTVTRLVTETAIIINARSIPCEHIDTCMYPLALDPELKSVASPGRAQKWERRSRLFGRQASKDPAKLHEAALLEELGNIWCSSLQQIFSAFGISQTPLYDPKVRQYIDEIVDRRNAVAHGRESPVDVGQGYTANTLTIRLEEIERQKEYLVFQFEAFLSSKAFVMPPFRKEY